MDQYCTPLPLKGYYNTLFLLYMFEINGRVYHYYPDNFNRQWSLAGVYQSYYYDDRISVLRLRILTGIPLPETP